jgi:glutamate--cysteine ligase
MVPHLTTALTGPLLDLERRILDNDTTVERWLRTQWLEHTPPFYSLGRPAQCRLQAGAGRHQPVPRRLQQPESGLPAAVRAGGDVGDREDLPRGEEPAAGAGEPHAQPVLPDERGAPGHHPAPHRPQRAHRQPAAGDHRSRPRSTCPTAEAGAGTAQAHRQRGPPARLEDFDPCAVLLNNDLSGGVPPLLENIHEQFLIPPLWAGWHVRRKSQHFAAYQDVAIAFAKASWASIPG